MAAGRAGRKSAARAARVPHRGRTGRVWRRCQTRVR